MNKMNFGRLFVAILGIAMAVPGLVGTQSAANAAYVLVDDFQNFSPPAGGLDISTQSGSGYLGTAGTGTVYTASKISGATSNALSTLNGGGASRYDLKTGAFSIADGTTATLFFQFIPLSKSADAQIGIGNSTSGSGFQERAGVQFGTNSAATALDGGGTAFAVTTNTPVNFWIVVHNLVGATADTYDVYGQTGSGSQTLITSGKAFRTPGDSANGGALAGALTSFNISTFQASNFAVDNIYVDTAGQNLVSAVPEPAALSLLAGCGLMLRRRRTAV